MQQLGFHPSKQPASLNDPCPPEALGALYLDFDNAYANLSVQTWFAVSDPVEAMICYSPALSQPPVWPTTATMTTSPSSSLTCLQCQSLSPSLATQPIKIERDREVAFKSSASYAKLICDALLSVPGHQLPLHGIYLWFRENTKVARDDGSTGWQSSIRYNLSRNPGFQMVQAQSRSGKRPKSIRALTSEALANGIKPTKRSQKCKRRETKRLEA
ncbi:hypothetical protein ASPFODRAFT_44638 [Aspergillus luchuensis CBS 106.47]|uniref:Fork-head domain-containing protein n=1 Tax=Aspergillus luchuensis (strain CBS 106.47) TaxID=1137211 RepID=A0A1M3TPN8_ASPLC|nr:hypothetical protein ASPFODRAFT_44638 [Aspergillus luchuensis CBS 106.47]